MAAVPPGLATALQDRYRLDRDGHGGPVLLGQGGMATVYLASRRLRPALGTAPEGAATADSDRRFSRGSLMKPVPATLSAALQDRYRPGRQK
jgi:hypothetical protein